MQLMAAKASISNLSESISTASGKRKGPIIVKHRKPVTLSCWIKASV